MGHNIKLQRAMILLERGIGAQQRGALSDAIELYERSLDVEPTPEAHTHLGWALSMLDRFDEAIAECKKGIALDPTYAKAYNDIGTYLLEMERPGEAIPWLLKATEAERNSQPVIPLLNLGRAYGLNGRYHAALQAYGRALEIVPFHLSAHSEKYLLLGKIN